MISIFHCYQLIKLDSISTHKLCNKRCNAQFWKSFFLLNAFTVFLSLLIWTTFFFFFFSRLIGTDSNQVFILWLVNTGLLKYCWITFIRCLSSNDFQVPCTHQASLQPCELSIAVLEPVKPECKKLQQSSPYSVPGAHKDSASVLSYD